MLFLFLHRHEQKSSQKCFCLQYKEDFVNLCEDGKVLVEGALPDIIKQDLDKVHLKQLIDHILKSKKIFPEIEIFLHVN